MKTTDKPFIQQFDLEGVKHILPEDALQAQKNNEAVIIDVREKNEIYAAHIENSLFHPMWKISEWLPSVPKEQNVILLCNKGIRSTHVTNFLMSQGYANVVNLDGGITAWKERKLPFVAFKHPKRSAD